MTITINGSGTVTGANTLTNTNTVTSAAATALTLQSAGTTAVTIDTSQNVGIGTSSPAYKLDVQTTSASGVRITSATSDTYIIPDFYGSGVTSILTGSGGGKQIAFGNSSTERMRIDSSGNLLVGTTSNPNTARVYVRYDSVSTQPIMNSATTVVASTSWSHFIGQSGNGSSITTNNIFIIGNGNIQNANNSYGGISDIKLKENIVDASPKLDKLMQVRIRNYNLKGAYEQHKQIGVVAQELETVFPSIVDQTPDIDAEGNDLGTTTKSVKYSVFVPMLIKAIQEQQALITSLTTRLTALENK